MFLLHPDIFWWDLLLLLLLSFSLSGICTCEIWCRRHRGKWLGKAGVRCVEVLALTGLALLVYGSFVEPHILTTTKFPVPFRTSESLRIVVIGDLHTGPYTKRGQIEKVVQRANQLLPDIVLLTGDFILGNTSDLTLLNPLADLHATQGVYAVLGNHDAGLVRSLGQNGLRRKHDRRDAIAAALEGMEI
ncbi:MAG: metallophosphoesterase, partial [Candidatus Peribacteraceae bacterium]|nr:metallophosphoesterase [Candidatus Peribacteraceae bacterium]